MNPIKCVPESNFIRLQEKGAIASEMGRKKVEINPISGIRVKMICKEKGITQEQLSGIINLSKKTVSSMINQKSSVTYFTAMQISHHFPEYSVAWIMGETDYRNKQEEFADVLKEMREELHNEGMDLYSGLFPFVKLNGYSIEKNKSVAEDKTLKLLQDIHGGYTFRKNDSSISLNLKELNLLANEICDYVALRLKYIEKGQ